MDIHIDCFWKDKKDTTHCLHDKNKKKLCHCNLEPCSLYEKKNLFKILKRRLKNGKI